MKVKFNFKTNEPTSNGRLYLKSDFIVAINNYMTTDVRPVFVNVKDYHNNLENVIGNVENVYVEENEIYADLKLFDVPAATYISEKCETEYQINPHMYGTLSSSDNVVSDVIIRFLELI